MRNLLNFFLKYNHCFLFLLLECISFVILFRFNHYQGSVFFTSANRWAGGIHQMVNHITDYFDLREINDALVQKNVELEMQIEQLRDVWSQTHQDSMAFNRMRHDALDGYRILKAKVINNSVIHADNFIMLDKGEKDGVYPEMGVVGGNGIVGIVYLTSSHYSIVISVLNSMSNISCKISRSDYFGILKWDGGSSQYAIVKDMPRHSLLSKGDTVVTSGHSAVFPSGISVGTVEDINDSQDGLSYLLKVKLFTDFARLNDVRVIACEGQQERLDLERKLKGNRK